MSERITESFKHLYGLFRNYSAFATIGVLVAALYGFFSSYPRVAIWTLVLLLSGIITAVAPNWIWFKHYKWHQNIRYIWFISKYNFREEILDILSDLEERGLRCHPPVFADFILYALLPSGNKETVLADLHEIYAKLRHRYQINSLRSKLHADLFYWKEVIRSIFPLLMWRLRSAFVDTSLPVEVRENIEDILPFYHRKN